MADNKTQSILLGEFIMRIINLFILTAAALLICLPASAATVLHYNCDQGTPGELINPGTAAAVGVPDLSGNGYDMWAWASATQNNGPRFSQEGESWNGQGLSLVFSGGQDGYTTAEGINSWSPLEWTIEVAVRLDTVNGWNTLIGRDGATYGGSEADFYLQENDAGGAIDDHFRINFLTVGRERIVLDSNFAAEANKWYRLAVVSDGKTVTMYCDKLDGNGYQVVGSMEFAGVGAENALAATNYSWTFGRGWYNGGQVDHIEGNLDDIKFSNVALPVNMLGFEPYAYDPQVTPINEDGSVGNLVVEGEAASAQGIMLSFKAGRDPNFLETGNLFNPGILAHHIYLSSPADQTPVYYATVQQTGSDPAVSYGPLTLHVGTTYYWRVEEALNDGAGQPRHPGDPNNLMGPVWSFTTIAPIPTIITHPANVVADAAGNAVITVKGSASAQYYKWFKVGDPDIELADNGKFSGTSTNTLTITGAGLEEEGQYYAIAYFGITPSEPSKPAHLWLHRLMGYWKFDGSMLDSVGEEVPGAPAHDGAIANSGQPGPGDENYLGEGNGIAGDAMAFQDDGDFVAIGGDPNFFNFFPRGFTTSLWYKADTSNPVGWRLPISKLDAGSAGWLFGTDHLYPAPYFSFILESPWNRLDGGTTPNIGDGQWHMLTVTYDPATTTVRLFTDGDEDSRMTLNMSSAPLPAAPLSIGGRDTENSISGAIDEVRLYSYPMTPTEVAQMYVGLRPDEYVCVSPDDGAFDKVDLNGDCKVNLEDVAVAAHEWLECQRVPVSSCEW